MLEQQPVSNRLMPALNLPLCHRVVGRTTGVFHPLVVEPFTQFSSDVARAVVGQ